MRQKSDIIIVGGGVIGSSIAYNLMNDGYSGQITVFEKDNIYEYSSTGRSAGGIRQLFTTKVNIEISRFGLKKYQTFPEDMAIGDEKAEIDFKQRGYLFLANQKNVNGLKQQLTLQNKLGVPSEFLSNEELLSIIPELNTEDLLGGLYCSEDGYLDPYSVMQGYARKARQFGVEYIYEEVEQILEVGGKVSGVLLVNGDTYEAPIVINCGGPWAPQLSEEMGYSIPVVPLKRQIIQYDIEQALQKPLPLTIDPTGVYFRHEGSSFITGFSEKVKPGINFNWSRDFFLEQLWPVLAERIPNFERAKIVSGWAGIYSYNTVDQNAIVGEHPQVNGYYLACGFSGHGMQQAPAVGKGISELIRTGKYDTLDLTPLRFERFEEQDLVVEGAVV